MGWYLTSGQLKNMLHLIPEQEAYSNFFSVQVCSKGNLIGADEVKKKKYCLLETFSKISVKLRLLNVLAELQYHRVTEAGRDLLSSFGPVPYSRADCAGLCIQFLNGTTGGYWSFSGMKGYSLIFLVWLVIFCFVFVVVSIF